MKLILERWNRYLNEAERNFTILYRGMKGDMVITPETSFDLDEWQKLFNKALDAGDRVAGERLMQLRRATSDQYFTDSLEVAKKHAGPNGTVYAMRVTPDLAAKGASRAVTSTLTMSGGGTSSLFKPSELLELAKKGHLKRIQGSGKVTVTDN